MARNFEEWLSTFTDNIANYSYYIDFKSVYRNIETYKLELNIMNSLIGSTNIEEEFEKILKKYPEVLKCIPLLLAVRQRQIMILDNNAKKYEYDFENVNDSIEQYKVFMRETGLFELIQNHLVNNIYDYALGVETGLNANARKNRGAHLMEDIVEKNIQKAGFIQNETYFKDMDFKEIKNKWNIDISHISSNNLCTKRIDFVVKTNDFIYLIETRYYSSGGFKINEIAKNYKMNKKEADIINGVKFVYFIDGMGCVIGKNALKEMFDSMEDIYNINDIKNGVMKKIFK